MERALEYVGGRGRRRGGRSMLVATCCLGGALDGRLCVLGLGFVRLWAGSGCR